MSFTYTAPVRFLEIDQQGVVFNMWYLAYMDEAFTALVTQGATGYDFVDAGFDWQVVHTELDWSGSLKWGDQVHVDVTVPTRGRTSFTVEFLIHAGDSTQPVVSARTVYVCIAADGSGKIEPPQVLLDALGIA
ncbi:thioesterase family protein [Mycolicibacterium sp. CBMA 234]|uniref:acyl-CoA thioesterase n=1 Tax=Mycolicibacterium sp. CBMA 234 TaxID=1918495 RepID=UPI00192E4B14|nr:acyl-CoA thioesterase [Mycolicibacterium sp. CBMA 234]